MKEIGTAAIIFERENLLARYVSLEAASQSNIFHCDDARCAHLVAQEKVDVDVAKLRKFVSWNQDMHARNRQLLKDAGIPALSLNYEKCAANSAECMDQVTSFLGVAPPKQDLAATTRNIRLVDSLRGQITNAEEVFAALVEDGNENWLMDDGTA